MTGPSVTLSRSCVALLYPGDRAMRDRPDPAESRFAALFEAFAQAGIAARAAVRHRVDSLAQLETELPLRLRAGARS
jgi:hypothetical protein